MQLSVGVALIRDLRFSRIAFYWLLFLGGIVIGNYESHSHIIKSQFFSISGLFFAFVACVFSCIVTNNLADDEIDRVSNPSRPHVQGIISKKTYQYLGRTGYLLSLAIAAGIDWKYALIFGLFVFNYFIYSARPFRIKRFTVISKSVIALNSFLMLLGGFIFSGGTHTPILIPLLIYCVIFGTLAANVIDLKDYEGDLKSGVKTLPVLLGKARAQKIIGGFIFLAYAAVPLAFKLNSVWLFMILLGALQYGVVCFKPENERLFFGLIYLTFLGLYCFV